MAPKYKLFHSAGSGEKICAFFSSPKGCKNGDNCKFVHTSTTNQSNSVSVESSSVVSSESSGDEASPPPTPVPIITPKSKKQKKSKGVNEETIGTPAHNTTNAGLNSMQKQFQDNLRLLQEQQHQLAQLQQKLLLQQNDPKEKPSKKRKQKDNSENSSIFATQKKSPSSVKKAKSKPDVTFESPFVSSATESVSSLKNKKSKEKQTSTKSKPPSGSYSALAYSSESSSDNNEAEEEEDDEGLQYLAELQARLTSNGNQTKPAKKGIQEQKNSNRNSSLASTLSLPVAPFQVRDPKSKSPKSPKAETKGSDKINAQIPSPLPSTSSDGYKFLPAIEKTRAHPRYNSTYNLKKYREEEGSDEWVQTQPYSVKHSSHPRAIAIDCEMVETTDPVSGQKDSKALARISVVNAIDTSEVLLDTLVKPAWPVTNYRTFVNGITKEDLKNVQFTLRHAQAFMMALCSEETVIVGHAVHNDLVSIKMEHYCNVDTAFMFHVKGDESEDRSSTPSLKDCATILLGKSMPNTHDSVNDAITSLDVCNHYIEKNGNVQEIVRSKKASSNDNESLFVHRIPSKGCTKKDISNMFLQNCYVKPKEVDDIEFGESTGKTHVRFYSGAHANLAFETLQGAIKTDKSGRDQKKVFMRNGNYIQVRKMIRPKAKKKS